MTIRQPYDWKFVEFEKIVTTIAVDFERDKMLLHAVDNCIEAEFSVEKEKSNRVRRTAFYHFNYYKWLSGSGVQEAVV